MPMSAPTFSFADFLLATKKHKITSAKEILNEAQKNTYFIRDALKGRDHKEFIRSGRSIIDPTSSLLASHK